MARVKPLIGVAHDIAHHARSGLSFLFPHLWEACQAAGVTGVTVNLLDSDPYPAMLREHGPLRLALGNLLKRFDRILVSRGLDVAGLSEARLDFAFPPRSGDGSIYGVHCTIVAKGERYEWDFPVPDELFLARLQRDESPIGIHIVRRSDL